MTGLLREVVGTLADCRSTAECSDVVVGGELSDVSLVDFDRHLIGDFSSGSLLLLYCCVMSRISLDRYIIIVAASPVVL